MTPITVSTDFDDDGDHYISLCGPEGYVCMDDAAARTAAQELETLADAHGVDGHDPDDGDETVEIDRTMLARLLGCANQLSKTDERWYPADQRAIETAEEALGRR